MQGPLRLAARLMAALALSVAATAPARAAHAAHSDPPVRVGIVLFDGVQIIDFAAPYEVFGQAGFGVVTVSESGAPVTTAMGLRVTPDHAFADAPAFDVLLVPGGDVEAARKNAAVLRFIRQRSAQARQVLSVCTGSHLLAGAGLLDGLKATTFLPQLQPLAKEFPAVEVVRDVRWVDNGKLITSAGLSSGIDAALHVVEKLRGTDAARSVALHLEYDWQRDGGFVRSRMADRHVPDIDVAWPADAALHRSVSVGDDRHWLVRLHTGTALPPPKLLALVADGMDKAVGWRRDPEGAKQTCTRETEGRRVSLHVETVGEAGPAGYELVVTLDVR